ncbi:DeoR/GlpR family DNA-binding transcription regulator [Bacillus massilinigeriensis]|uniref:DeoR/GlpR family DNA-binding transcription regulator n=1 Tax=Bacillus massilionigeriensis TaxID=1805475 RepID=UPI00096B046A|nr:DeoR/GlpR family DNA-binding transcription regulator [Bacillus massilionigeriensis]
MLQEERHKQILEQLEENNTVRISELSESLGVTKQTVRRDLSELEKAGFIKKVHGGAILNRTNIEPSYSKRESTSVIEKELIAEKAAEFVEDGDAIFLDIGTTTLILAKKLKSRKNLTVITNSLLVALEFAHSPEIKVILSGGELRGEELSLSGPISTKSMNDIFIDKAFIGVGGLAIESGYTDYHLGEAEFRRIMIKHSKRSFALADYSKMNIIAIYKTAELEEVDVLITDKNSPANLVSHLIKNGVEVITLDLN